MARVSAKEKTEKNGSKLDSRIAEGSWVAAPERAKKNQTHLQGMEDASPKSGGLQIILPQLKLATVELSIVGTSELIVHNWSEKQRRQIRDKQTGTASAGREKKDPVADFLGSLYTIKKGKVMGDKTLEQRTEDGHPNVWLEGGKFGIPTIAFKNAMVTACTSLGRSVVTKTAARQAFHVVGSMTEIDADLCRMREDMVRVGAMKDTADIRYRAGFPEWSCKIQVIINQNVMSPEQVANLLNLAGFAVGIFEWRCECGGNYGAFEVERS